MMATTLTPAPGRDYETKNAVLEAFLGGEDFAHGAEDGDSHLVNRAQIEGAGETEVSVRYHSLSRVVVLERSDGLGTWGAR